MIPRAEFIERQGLVEITTIALPERAKSQQVREALARENYDPEQVIMENKDILNKLPYTPFRKIGQKLVKGDTLTFEEAFLGMTFVISATNRALFQNLQSAFQIAHSMSHIGQEQLIGPAQTFLTAMAQRETHGTLTTEEVAGMVAAAMMDINLRLGFQPYVLETGGMGGDKGFIVDGERRKVINASTLSAIVLASMDIPVVKHGSYANTSAIGSTETIEALGINIYQRSFGEIKRLFGATNFYFSDAHIAKTIHDLSHSPFMRHETINHLIGPMTPPIDRKTRLNKVIGVNEGVHPALIAQAYEVLNAKGYQTVGNVVVVSGLDKDFTEEKVPDVNDIKKLRSYMMLDEISPYKSLLAIVQNGRYMGCFIVCPEDFGVKIDPAQIQIVNTKEELLIANGQALKGLSRANSDYLAINAAIGLFAAEYLNREHSIIDGQLSKECLQECFRRCKEAIISGKSAQHLEKIVAVSNGKEEKKKMCSIFDGVDMVIFDLDLTLVTPKDTAFYGQYSEAVNRAVAKRLGISFEKGKKIVDYYRKHFNGGERALFSGTIHHYFPEFPQITPDFEALYEEMCTIDPTGQFEKIDALRDAIQQLRSQGKKVVVLTDSPEGLSRKILVLVGFNPDADFDLYLSYTKEHGPHKIMRGKEVFQQIASHFQILPERVLSIGDSVTSDIRPAQDAGMKTCLIGKTQVKEYKGLRVDSILDIFEGRIYKHV